VLDVLVVGDLNPDLLLWGDVVPRFGQAEQDVDAAVALGGSGGIVAAALARLGLDVGLAAAVGGDELGRLVTQRLVDRGVGIAQLQPSDRATGLSVHLLDGDDRAILTSTGAMADLDIDAACAAIAHTEPHHVHLTSAYLIPALLHHGDRLLAAARGAGATVSIDTNYDPAGAFAVPPWLRAVDLLLPNAAEALGLTGRAPDDEAAVEDAARDLAGDGATVVVKLGAQGALAVSGPHAEALHQAAPPAPTVVDAVGAGDAFDAGLIRARLDNRPLQEQLALATAAGTLSVRDRGDRGQPTFEEVLELAGSPT
jgi:sugar/nucleoside kinase (ribokinase family)